MKIRYHHQMLYSDTFVPALKLLEMLITMKTKLGIDISKRGLYQSPPQDAIEKIKTM